MVAPFDEFRVSRALGMASWQRSLDAAKDLGGLLFRAWLLLHMQIHSRGRCLWRVPLFVAKENTKANPSPFARLHPAHPSPLQESPQRRLPAPPQELCPAKRSFGGSRARSNRPGQQFVKPVSSRGWVFVCVCELCL